MLQTLALHLPFVDEPLFVVLLAILIVAGAGIGMVIGRRLKSRK